MRAAWIDRQKGDTMIHFIESPKQKRIKNCSKCERIIQVHEAHYVETVEIGGGVALEEYCIECIGENKEVRNG